MLTFDTDRERSAQELADKLFFEFEKNGDRYTPRRKIGDHATRENLTIEEVEAVLERWKLEGPHGG